MSNIPLHWFKSSYSGGQQGNCVQTTALLSAVGVRDSKDPGMGHITIEPVSWSVLLGTIKQA